MDSSWNEVFLDAKARTYATSDDSDDLDFVPSDSANESDDDDLDITIPIPVRNTQLLHEWMEGPLVEKIIKVLEVMEDLKINLTIFLDALSWGDVACISNATVRYACTGLMKNLHIRSSNKSKILTKIQTR
jgi:hypothetical protein